MTRDLVREKALWYVPMSRRLAARWIVEMRRLAVCHHTWVRLSHVKVNEIVAQFEVQLGLGNWKDATVTTMVRLLRDFVWNEHFPREASKGLAVQNFMEKEKNLIAEIELLS